MYLLFNATIVEGYIELLKFWDKVLSKSLHFSFYEEIAHQMKQTHTLSLLLH